MKNCLVIFLSTLVMNFCFAGQLVNNQTAMDIAKTWLTYQQPNNSVAVQELISFTEKNGNVLFYLVKLNPKGFLVISANYDLPPVIAYSLTNDPDREGRLTSLLQADLSQRIRNIPKLPAELLKERHQAWELLSFPSPAYRFFQQWPDPGTTSTGGWLETNWTQDPPYNLLCPIDPVTFNRSIAGCPAVAMSQIVNFHSTTNLVHFTDVDDYYHNYQGRQYYIDDDHLQQDFPSWSELNDLLDTIDVKYHQNIPLKDQEKAALVYACGAAATQVFTSTGSGTFGVSQAFAAFQKFNFSEVELLHDTDTNLYSRMAQNIKDTLPVHLAVVDPGWTMGHNVVVDGYNTDNYFHLNFGWGGAANGWYLLPDEIPYGLTVIEGAIVDIIPDNTTGMERRTSGSIAIYPNPARDKVNIRTWINENSTVTLYSINGRQLKTKVLPGPAGFMDISGYPDGSYLLKITNIKETKTEKFTIRNH